MLGALVEAQHHLRGHLPAYAPVDIRTTRKGGGEVPHVGDRIAEKDDALLAAAGRSERTIGVADVEIRSSDGRLIAIARCKTVNNAPAREGLTKTGGES